MMLLSLRQGPMDVIQDMINGLYERVDKRLDTIGHACMH